VTGQDSLSLGTNLDKGGADGNLVTALSSSGSYTADPPESHTAHQAESYDQADSQTAHQAENYSQSESYTADQADSQTAHQAESYDQAESYEQAESQTTDEGEPIGLYSGDGPESSPETREAEPIADDAPARDRLAARRAAPETAREAADILSGAVRSTSQFIRERDRQWGRDDPVLARAIAEFERILEALRQSRQGGESLPAGSAGEESYDASLNPSDSGGERDDLSLDPSEFSGEDASLDPSEVSGGDEDPTGAPLPLDALLSDLPGGEQEKGGMSALRRWRRSK